MPTCQFPLTAQQGYRPESISGSHKAWQTWARQPITNPIHSINPKDIPLKQTNPVPKQGFLRLSQIFGVLDLQIPVFFSAGFILGLASHDIMMPETSKNRQSHSLTAWLSGPWLSRPWKLSLNSSVLTHLTHLPKRRASCGEDLRTAIFSELGSSPFTNLPKRHLAIRAGHSDSSQHPDNVDDPLRHPNYPCFLLTGGASHGPALQNG